MLGLNRPNVEYRVKMYWFKYRGSKNAILEYDELGLPFTCKFASLQDVTYISNTQGIIFNELDIETIASYSFKKNDKITYNGARYMVVDVSVDNTSLSGSDYTNKPSAIIQVLSLKGIPNDKL